MQVSASVRLQVLASVHVHVFRVLASVRVLAVVSLVVSAAVCKEMRKEWYIKTLLSTHCDA